MGETSTYKLAFIQDDKTDDLRLILRSRKDQPVFTEAEHWRKYRALTSALSFVHGINAWPHWLQYERGSDKCCDQLAPAFPAPRTSHAPFGGISHDKNIAGFLPRLAERLELDTLFNNELTTLIYLVRQAGAKGVHGKIGSLTLCAALESLTKLLFKERGLQEPPAPPQHADFAVQNEALLAYLDALDKSDASNRRLRKFIASARPVKPLKVEEKFEAVCNHLGLPWDGRWRFRAFFFTDGGVHTFNL